MRRLLAIFLMLMIGLQVALAQDVAITLDGESFSKKFVGNPPNGDKLIEFVRESESFEQWTKLIGFRYQQLPGIQNDPIKIAAFMAQTLKTANAKAQSQVIANKEKTEAILDFITWPPDGKFMEFNVFRFTKSSDGRAVVSLQFAHRFTDTSPEGQERFKQLRQSWVNQAVGFNMNTLHLALSQ